MSGPAVLVLHALGDEQAGGPWGEAFRKRWPGPVLAPDLPGHGLQPAPVGGCYELTDPAFVALRAVLGAGLPAAPIVVGVGTSGWSAQLFALAGRSCGLVTVDGLGGPWRTPEQTIHAGRDLLRSITADPAAAGPPATPGLDPRLRHEVPPQADRRLAERAAGALTVPTLVIETPRSPLRPDEARQLVDHMGSTVEVRFAPDRDPAQVAEAVLAWSTALDRVAATGAPP